MTGEGLIVAYRDRSEEESTLPSYGSKWENGCPIGFFRQLADHRLPGKRAFHKGEGKDIASCLVHSMPDENLR